MLSKWANLSSDPNGLFKTIFNDYNLSLAILIVLMLYISKSANKITPMYSLQQYYCKRAYVYIPSNKNFVRIESNLTESICKPVYCISMCVCTYVFLTLSHWLVRKSFRNIRVHLMYRPWCRLVTTAVVKCVGYLVCISDYIGVWTWIVFLQQIAKKKNL